MNLIDELKLLRLQEEKRYIHADLVEALARQLLTGLVQWANAEIFAPTGGELTLDITPGAPNASVTMSSARPDRPRMQFRSSLISRIYADAFSFPLICRRLAEETDTLENFNESPLFRDCRVRFDGPLPVLRASDVAEPFRPACATFVGLTSAGRDDDRQLRAEDVRCRFVMFELMLAWTFLHELGHVVQGHHRMCPTRTSALDEHFGEFDELHASPRERTSSEVASDALNAAAAPDLVAQARELMADAEATDQTLKYLVTRGRLNFAVWYLLLCSAGCMFQRFYDGYPDDLRLSPSRHPHPLIRDEASQILGTNWLADYLVACKQVRSRDEAAMPLTDLSVRASLVNGLFRSHRVEKRDDANRLPSYMALTRDGVHQQRDYMRALLPEIERQLPMAIEHHLIHTHSLEYWFGYLKAAAQEPAHEIAGGVGPAPA